MTVEQDPQYIQQLDALLSKMDRAHHFARVCVASNTAKRTAKFAFPVGVAVAAITCAGLGLAVHPQAPEFMSSAKPGDLVGMIATAGVVLGWSTGAAVNHAPTVGLVLSAFGRSLPLAESQSKKINDWMNKFPGMTQIVAKWGAHNKDVQLNRTDFHKIKRWVDRAESLYTATDVRLKDQADRKIREELLSSSGLSSAIHKTRLETIAEQSSAKAGIQHATVAAKPPLM